MQALFNLFNIIWKNEQKPSSWCNSTIIQLYKGKGNKGDLDNMRHIHTKAEIPKFFGQIVFSTAKNKIYIKFLQCMSDV